MKILENRLAILATLVGLLAFLVGMAVKVDRQAEGSELDLLKNRVSVEETRRENMKAQLDRIEDKLDLLMDR